MPILDASALEDDPEGVALLRDVLGPPKPRQGLGRPFDKVMKATVYYVLIQSRAAARDRTPMKLEAVFS